ncbi:MAG: hypothetical protein VSS75_021570 [Candidatus Parabeggiatoa sp.]|nr:hypothetical protein [Candidatus Parabeggiatoa sp.]
MNTSRLRLVAGPNDSGKSTFTDNILKRYVNLGVYVNPDEIAKTLAGDELTRAKEAQQAAVRQREEIVND